MKAALLARIEAWLESPAGRDETAELFMDIASAIEDGSLITPIPPPTTLGLRLQQVLGLIQERPGISTQELATALSLSTGNIAAAASRLRKKDLIRSERGKRGAHFFALTQEAPTTVLPTTPQVQSDSLLVAIQARPGITAKDLMEVFGLSQSTLHTAISRLRKAGLIRSEQGRAYAPRSVHYYAQEIKA